MRATLATPALARLAGRFVWLELNFDQPANREFLDQRRLRVTPTLYVLDSRDGHADAVHEGGTTEAGLLQFLEQGERAYRGAIASAADSALGRGDRLLGMGRPASAVDAYREALRRAVRGWPARAEAVSRLTSALASAGDHASAAEIAMREAPGMPRGQAFASVVEEGLSSAARMDPVARGDSAARALEPFAAEAILRSDITRDTRFQLYVDLIASAQRRADTLAVERWGASALRTVDAIHPTTQDEAIALDIVRVELVWDRRSAEHLIPALSASERAMRNPNTSIRLAQTENFAGRWDDAIAACRRGLGRPEGPIVRTWLLELEAEAWLGKGDRGRARATLDLASRSAQRIGPAANRVSNLRRISALRARAGSG